MSLRSSPVKTAGRAAEVSLLFFLVVYQSRHYARMASFIKRFDSSRDCYPKTEQSAFPLLLSLGIPLNSFGYRKMTRVLFYQHQYTKIYKTSLPMVASSHKTTPNDHLQ